MLFGAGHNLPLGKSPDVIDDGLKLLGGGDVTEYLVVLPPLNDPRLEWIRALIKEAIRDGHPEHLVEKQTMAIEGATLPLVFRGLLDQVGLQIGCLDADEQDASAGFETATNQIRDGDLIPDRGGFLAGACGQEAIKHHAESGVASRLWIEFANIATQIGQQVFGKDAARGAQRVPLGFTCDFLGAPIGFVSSVPIEVGADFLQRFSPATRVPGVPLSFSDILYPITG